MSRSLLYGVLYLTCRCIRIKFSFPLWWSNGRSATTARKSALHIPVPGQENRADVAFVKSVIPQKIIKKTTLVYMLALLQRMNSRGLDVQKPFQ